MFSCHIASHVADYAQEFHLIHLDQEHLHVETQVKSERNQFSVVLQGLLEDYLSSRGKGAL